MTQPLKLHCFTINCNHCHDGWTNFSRDCFQPKIGIDDDDDYDDDDDDDYDGGDDDDDDDEYQARAWSDAADLIALHWAPLQLAPASYEQPPKEKSYELPSKYVKKKWCWNFALLAEIERRWREKKIFENVQKVKSLKNVLDVLLHIFYHSAVYHVTLLYTAFCHPFVVYSGKLCKSARYAM